MDPAFALAIKIRRPPAAVFALLADIQDVEPIPRSAQVVMIKEPLGATAVGTHWHERVKIAPGCWLRVENVVTELSPPDMLHIVGTSRWFVADLTYRIEAAPGGSVLRHEETVRLRPALAWCGPLFARSLRPRLELRLRDIKTILETA